MTDRPGQASPSPVPATEPEPGLGIPTSAPDDTTMERVRALCPHLVSADGDWRSLIPAREHVCAAVDPPVPVALDKQRRLCLVGAHVECATYLAARSALVEDAAPGRPDGPVGRRGPIDGQASADAGAAEGPGRAAESTARGAVSAGPRWPVPRTAPVVVDRGRLDLAALRLDRSVAQVGLVALMILAFAVLAVARLSSDGGSGAATSPTPSAAASPTPRPSTGPSPTPRPTASPSVAPSVSPPASPAASPSAAARTYRVRSGDTLSAIAARFGTTVAVLRELNDIADPSLLRVGQVLRLP